jgi:hypothetical protein
MYICTVDKSGQALKLFETQEMRVALSFGSTLRYMCVCVCVCVCLRMYLYVYVCLRVCVLVSVQTNRHKDIQSFGLTYMYIYNSYVCTYMYIYN